MRVDGLRPYRTEVKLLGMKRELIALILVVLVGLQGSMAAFASSSPLMSPDCEVAVTTQGHGSQDSCCPNGQQSMSCCIDLCLSTALATTFPVAMTLSTQGAVLPLARPTIFCSRGDSPLIRPPIL
jgi:hypothetical protein